MERASGYFFIMGSLCFLLAIVLTNPVIQIMLSLIGFLAGVFCVITMTLENKIEKYNADIKKYEIEIFVKKFDEAKDLIERSLSDWESKEKKKK